MIQSKKEIMSIRSHHVRVGDEIYVGDEGIGGYWFSVIGVHLRGRHEAAIWIARYSDADETFVEHPENDCQILVRRETPHAVAEPT